MDARKNMCFIIDLYMELLAILSMLKMEHYFKNAQLPQEEVSAPLELKISAKCEAFRTGATPDAPSADSVVTSHLTGHL